MPLYNDINRECKNNYIKIKNRQFKKQRKQELAIFYNPNYL